MATTERHAMSCDVMWRLASGVWRHERVVRLQVYLMPRLSVHAGGTRVIPISSPSALDENITTQLKVLLCYGYLRTVVRLVYILPRAFDKVRL